MSPNELPQNHQTPPNQQNYLSPRPQPLNSYGNQPALPEYESPKNTGRRTLVIGALIGLLVLVGVGIFAFLNLRTTPEGVFAGAVESSLSTKQVKQIGEREGSRQEVLYDVSRSTDPRLFAETTMDSGGINLHVKQYANLKNSYILFEEFDLLTAPLIDDFQGKWLQERKNGKSVPETGSSILASIPDAHYYFLGDWIFGSFSEKDKAELKNYIINEKVYGYNPDDVKKVQLNGQDTYAYGVTQKSDKLLELNKKVAAIWGLDQKSAEGALTSTPQIEKSTMYIDIKTKRFVRIEVEYEGVKATTNYTYDNVDVSAEPKPQANYVDFVEMMRDFGSIQPETPTDSNNSNVDEDTGIAL